MSETIAALADYFSGPEVARASICMGLPPGGDLQLRESAERFFAVRAALGVRGYPTAAEAARTIRESLGL